MNHETQRPSTQPTARIVETPGMSYGLFHAVAQPVLSWGVIRQVKFPGVNLDIGQLRHHTWSKDNDSQAWIARPAHERP